MAHGGSHLLHGNSSWLALLCACAHARNCGCVHSCFHAFMCALVGCAWCLVFRHASLPRMVFRVCVFRVLVGMCAFLCSCLALFVVAILAQVASLVKHVAN